jgi:hypothetical protein
MSYVINKTNGEVLTTLLDGTTNTDTGLTLIGRNYPSYGEIQNENFVRLLENFSDNIPPGESVGFTPIAGQLWWDSGTQRLKVYNGIDFIPVSEQTSSSTAPSTVKTGDQWWDTVNQQLKIWTGTGWQLIGPVYTATQGLSGEVISTITDTAAASHVVVNTYAGGTLIAITSADPEFAPATPIAGFANIVPGINLVNSSVINATANNSVRVGGLYANVLARTDITTTFNDDVLVTGKVRLTDANVYFANKSVVIENKNLGGNVEIYTNTTSHGNVKSILSSGDTGLVYVSADPTGDLGIATKHYVDQVNSTLTGTTATQISEINGNVDQLRADYLANISVVIQDTNANLYAVQSSTNANIAALTLATDNRFTLANANASSQAGSINSLIADVALKAYINNPSFTGIVTAPNVAPSNGSNVVATTYYVDRADAALTVDYTGKVNTATTTLNANIASGLAIKANINSPVLTGVPTAPTPAAGNNSVQIATTAFVTSAIVAKQFNYTVANTGPGDLNGVISSTNGSAGNDGDFWFQIG